MEFKVIREKLSSRGGGIEIDLTPFGKKWKGEKMTAYQNYLGGGMSGSIANDCTFDNWRSDKVLEKIATNLRKYFAELMEIDYDTHQSRPYSAY